MESKNLIVVFLSGVYLAGNSNAPKIVYFPQPPLSAGGSSLCIKTKLKSEIFKDDKSLQKKMFLSVLTKNLNWESLTKNLFTLNLLWEFTEKSDFFRGRVIQTKSGHCGKGVDSFQN